jgi:hypothetical protein
MSTRTQASMARESDKFFLGEKEILLPQNTMTPVMNCTVTDVLGKKNVFLTGC